MPKPDTYMSNVRGGVSVNVHMWVNKIEANKKKQQQQQQTQQHNNDNPTVIPKSTITFLITGISE